MLSKLSKDGDFMIEWVSLLAITVRKLLFSPFKVIVVSAFDESTSSFLYY